MLERNPKSKRLVPALLDWFAANARDLPWRRTRDPYAIWVSEIMLQQTQVKTVVPYWQRWMRELPDIKGAANASPNKIHKLWEGLGYYTRARNLQKAAQEIVAKHRGKFPQNFDDVLALPGIGRYTAGAICSIAFNQPTPILDGNVIRVLTRIFGIGENPREKKTNARLWQLAEELVACAGGARLRRAQILFAGDRVTRKRSHGSTESRPTENTNYSHLNQSLMELGALVCTPRNPQCPICSVKNLCVAFRDNRVEELPNLGKRVVTTGRHFVAFVAEREGRFLVRQRPVGVVNAHLWEFPNVEILNGKFNPKLTAKNVLGLKPPGIKPLCTVKHSITRYRIMLEAFQVRFGRASSASPKHSKMGYHRTPPSEGVGVWFPLSKLNTLAFTAAHKTILNLLRSPSDVVGSTRLRRVVSGVAPETGGKQRW
jgi:A/G-specific adenine glycosylase